jgi:hypothetical protein
VKWLVLDLSSVFRAGSRVVRPPITAGRTTRRSPPISPSLVDRMAAARFARYWGYCTRRVSWPEVGTPLIYGRGSEVGVGFS